MLQACGHMAEMPFKQQSYCSCNRVFTQTKHKHVPVLLTTGKNKPTFDPSNLSRTPLRVHSLWRGLRRVWRGVFYLAPFFQEEHPGSCDSEHSPELLEDHLRQEEYDRCEHDVGTFRNQKWQWLLVLQNTTRQMLKNVFLRIPCGSHVCIKDTNFLSSLTDHWLQINNVSKKNIISIHHFKKHIQAAYKDGQV